MNEALKQETREKLNKWLEYRNSIYHWGEKGTLCEGFILGIDPDYDYEKELELQKDYQKSLQELIQNKN